MNARMINIVANSQPEHAIRSGGLRDVKVDIRHSGDVFSVGSLLVMEV
jgi:hypothetical protein